MEEKRNNIKEYQYEMINGQKIKKRKIITFLDLLINDYLNIEHHDWIYFKENHDEFMVDELTFDQHIQVSELKKNFGNMEIIKAQQISHQNSEAFKPLLTEQFVKMK